MRAQDTAVCVPECQRVRSAFSAAVAYLEFLVTCVTYRISRPSEPASANVVAFGIQGR